MRNTKLSILLPALTAILAITPFLVECFRNERASGEMQDAIKSHDIDKVSSIISAHPRCVNVKKDLSPYWLILISQAPSPTYPLQAAARHHDFEIIQLLLNSGADVNAAGRFGDSSKTPLIMNAASKCDDRELVYRIAVLLLKYGADKKHTDFKGKTAYDYAIEYGDERLAELLKPIET